MFPVLEVLLVRVHVGDERVQGHGVEDLLIQPDAWNACDGFCINGVFPSVRIVDFPSIRFL